jgi:glycerophosphoryl diester phosphodiesterase
MSRIVYVLFATAVTAICAASVPFDNAAASKPKPPLAGVDLEAYLDCAREQGVTLLQAHRGGDRPGAAENSLAAINASLADGAVFLELDVARTADGVLILMHDDTLDRTTTGSGPVAATSHKAMAGLTLLDSEGRDTGEPIPTLTDALDTLNGRGITQIDRKKPTTFGEIADVLEAEDAVGRSLIIAYSINEALEIHQRLPDAVISVGIRSLDEVESLRAAGINPARVLAWLGLGSGDPALDKALAAQGIETSYADFRAEAEGMIDYWLLAENGAEVISVDNVPEAARALDAIQHTGALLHACELIH